MALIPLPKSSTAARVMGWTNEDGSIVARAEVRTAEAGLELTAMDAPDVEDAVAMVLDIAAVAPVPAIVTHLTDPWLADRCGFVDGVLDLQPAVVDPTIVGSTTLTDLEAAIVASWGPETSSGAWSEGNPACGQCDVTALVVRDLLGGSIVCCNVVRDGQRVERHAWNVLDSGLAVDLTRRQYDGVEGMEFEGPVVREPDDIGDLGARTAILAGRVRERLGQVRWDGGR